MLKIVVVAEQNKEISNLCSELNKYGFQCSTATGENALEQESVKAGGRLIDPVRTSIASMQDGAPTNCPNVLGVEGVDFEQGGVG